MTESFVVSLVDDTAARKCSETFVHAHPCISRGIHKDVRIPIDASFKEQTSSVDSASAARYSSLVINLVKSETN